MLSSVTITAWRWSIMKGTISKNLRAILRDSDGRKQLQRVLITKSDGEVRVGRTKYKVSRGDSSVRTLRSDSSLAKGLYRKRTTG